MIHMPLTLCSIALDFRRKPEASKISVKALISLFQEAVRLDQPDTLGGSLESLESYYKMNRQFAAMARKYRPLISSELDSDSILILADYVLNLELEEFKKIANNLPFLLNGSVFQENSAVQAHTPEPRWNLSWTRHYCLGRTQRRNSNLSATPIRFDLPYMIHHVLRID